MTNHNRQPAGQPTGGQFAEGARASAGVSLSLSASEAITYRDDEFGEYTIDNGLEIEMDRCDGGRFVDANLETLRAINAAGIRGKAQVATYPDGEWMVTVETPEHNVLGFHLDCKDPENLEVNSVHPVGWVFKARRNDSKEIASGVEAVIVGADTARNIGLRLEDDLGVDPRRVRVWQPSPGITSVSTTPGRPPLMVHAPVAGEQAPRVTDGKTALTFDQASEYLRLGADEEALREILIDSHFQARDYGGDRDWMTRNRV